MILTAWATSVLVIHFKNYETAVIKKRVYKYVKALLCVMNRKYSTRGGVDW